MVAPERISANTVFPFDIKTNTNLQESSSRMTINMEVDTPRGRSVSSSANSSRSASALSNVSSKAYVDCIQELSNSPAWAEQVENEVFQSSPLSYATGEYVSTNQASNVELNRAPIEAASNNTCSTQGLEPSVIPYTANQPRIANYGMAFLSHFNFRNERILGR